MRTTFAKCITILILGVMLLGAASAQTGEKEWRWVSYPSLYAYDEYPTADLHALCVIAVKANADSSGTPWEYIGTYEVASNMIHCNEKFRNEYFSFSQMRPHCRFGGVWNATRPEGCYELKETTENCHVVGTSEGYPVCGDEPEEEAECPEEPFAEDAFGAVACEKGKKSKPCAWDNPYLKDKQARDTAKACTLKHEQLHIDNAYCFGEGCDAKGYATGDYPYLYQDEMLGHRADMRCLEQGKKECKTKECNDDIDTAIDNAVSHIDGNYSKYCAYPGTDCTNFEFKCQNEGSRPSTGQ